MKASVSSEMRAWKPVTLFVGKNVYEDLCKAIGKRFRRGAGQFETYQFVPIVLDPFRDDTVCVLPSPTECARGVQGYRME